jgi:tetratricopeptide (TPR) repeat protein
MTPRARVILIAAAAAVLAAGGTVALAVVTAKDKGGSARKPQPLAGAPPLVLDLGVRDDPEARALRRAESLYDHKRRGAAGRIFAHYDSPAAQLGAALSAWPDGSLARVEGLARERPRDSLVLLHLGYARIWAGFGDAARAAWQEALKAEPDSPAAQRADDVLHPRFPSGQPFFVPSFATPAGLDRLTPPQQLAALARAARRLDVHARLLYGLALQRLGHRLSAVREFEAAARLGPQDPEAQVAAALGHFQKSSPAAAFSRLGPLARRFPHAATVRFHLGLLLLWLARVQPGAVAEAKRQLRLTMTEEPKSLIAREAKRLLASLEGIRTK